MAFIVDTRGSGSLVDENETHPLTENVDDSDDDFMFIPLKPPSSFTSAKLENEFELDESYPSFKNFSRPKSAFEYTTKAHKKTQKTPIDSILAKSATLQPGLEKLERVPSYSESKRVKQKQRKAMQEKTKGAKWFNLPAPEVTEEIKNDIEALQMRSALDPKHFYKKNDMKHTPKYFQIGRVVDSPADFYSSRVPKKERKRTLVDDLLADAEFQRQTKRRYKEIITERQKTTLQSVRQKRREQRKKSGKSNKNKS